MVSKVNSWPTFTTVGGICTALLLCAGCLILAAPAAWAGKYAYGEKFVRVGQSWPDGSAAQGAMQISPGPEQDDADYQQQVAELERQGGPYADALAETLAGLGRYHRSNGDLLEAQRLYRRALHVARVNDGLYSERQIPILQELLQGYRMAGDLQTLDDRYNYYFRLYGNGQAPYTDVRLGASLAYLRWQREAVRLEIDDDYSRRLLALYQLNEELLAAVSADTSVALHWYQDLVLSQLRNLYLLEDRFAPTVDNRVLAPAVPLFSNELDQEDFNKRRLETLQRGSLSRGTDLLQALIARTSDFGGVTELAGLHLELGDWYQWHGRENPAGQQYGQVVQLLSDDGRQDLLQQWLAQPVELPDNGAFWQSRSSPQEQSPVVVSMRYDVSAKGRVSNMQASVSDPDDERLATRLKRKLRQIRFRPRWVTGVAEPVASIQRDYELLN